MRKKAERSRDGLPCRHGVAGAPGRRTISGFSRSSPPSIRSARNGGRFTNLSPRARGCSLFAAPKIVSNSSTCGPGSSLSRCRRENDVRQAHDTVIHTATYSPDGEWIASGSDDRTIRIWHRVARDAVAVLPGHREAIHAIEFHPDGNTLVSGSGDKTVRLWDTVPLDQRRAAREQRAR